MIKKIFLILLSIVLSISLFSQTNSWLYQKPIYLKGNYADTLNNAIIKIVVNTDSLISLGQMNEDCSDLRLAYRCDDTTFLNYYIESGINSDSTVILFRINNLISDELKTIYLLYGETSAISESSYFSLFASPNSGTNHLTSELNYGASSNSQRGFQFKPLKDIIVTSFGKYEPNGTTRFVTLFNYQTQAIIYQTQVSGPAAVYSYTELPTPIKLSKDSNYVIVIFQGESDGYYWGSSSQVGTQLQYINMLYCNTCTQNTFPTNSITNRQYGLPDFQYYIVEDGFDVFESNISHSDSLYACDSIIYNSVVFNATGVYNVVIPSYQGCDSVVQLKLTILNSSGTIVNVDECYYYVSPSGNYIWTESGVYYDTIPNSEGCDSIITVVLTIPEINVAVVQNNDSLIAQADNVSYQWLDCNDNYSIIHNANEKIFIPQSSGNYAVEITYNQCVDTSDCFQVIIDGLKDNSFSSEFIVSPNPTNGKFIIDLNQKYESVNYSIRIYNGQTIYSESLNNTSKIDAEINSIPGVYFVEIIIPNHQPVTLKVIKQ